MKTFNWVLYEKQHSSYQVNYMRHVHNRNIQEGDFARGYSSLRPADGGKVMNQRMARKFYRKLRDVYGFFEVEKAKV